MLAEVFYQGKNINLGMVQMGLAEVYRGTLPKGFNLSPYQRAQKNARKNQKGIWSQKSHYQSPREWRKKNPWK
ncbi:MAG: thermonuclease family protein [Desulfobacter sp.]|nr:MAG: thermonuclease family protein [Desulfobacter sp.]